VKPLHELKRDIVQVCRKIDERAYVGGRDGNVSALASDRTIVITPSAVRKGDVKVDDLIVVDRSGRRVQGRASPSTETGMHLRIYDLRPDVRAVVHAHPPVATGFAAAGVALSECVLPEVIVGLGNVPLARYAAPGTPELVASLDPVIQHHDAFLLENHGAVTVGGDVLRAHQAMETVEHSARILLVARLLGGPRALGPEQVRELIESRGRYGVREGLAGCFLPEAGGGGGEPLDEDALVERVTRRILADLEG
jgi:L-fuculose-phosphate aldolase